MSCSRALVVLFHAFFTLSFFPLVRGTLLMAPDTPPTSNTITLATDLRAQEQSFDSFDLTTDLPRSPSSYITLPTIPSNCAAYMTGPTPECTVGMTAYNVTFDDCGDPWTVCRCNNANMTLDTVVDRLARVPVGLRRYIATVIVQPDTTTHAYTLTSGDIHFFGDCQMNTFVHESIHAFDFASGTPFSGSAGWLDAIGADSCAPDDYSLTDAIEDFAQLSVLKVYALAHNGSLPPGWESECMGNQLAFLDTLPLYNVSTIAGNTCEIFSADNGTSLDVFSRHNHPPATLNTTVVFPLPNVGDSPTTTTAAASSASGLVKVPISTVVNLQPSASTTPSNLANTRSVSPYTLLIPILVGFLSW